MFNTIKSLRDYTNQMANQLSVAMRKFNNEVYEEQTLLVHLDASNLARYSNWTCNRPPCDQKVAEIIASINNDMFTPAAIHTFLDTNNHFVIYDGTHRMTAFKRMLEQPESAQKVKEYMSGSFVTTVLIKPSEEYVVERFRQINMSTPVPELYKQPERSVGGHVAATWINLIKVVPAFVQAFKTEWRCFKSTNRPQRPNYNPSTLCDDMFQLVTEHPVLSERSDTLTVDMLMLVVMLVNTRYKQEALDNPLSVGVKMVERCQYHNLFLWVHGDQWRKDVAEELVKQFGTTVDV